MPASDIWEIHSDTAKTSILSVAIGAAGILIMYLSKGQAAVSVTALSGFWLGVMLLGITLASLVLMEQIIVTVDIPNKLLNFKKKSYWETSSSVLNFSEIESICVAKTGDGSDGTASYSLSIKLKNGSTQATGKWSVNQHEMDELAGRLASDIGCGRSLGEPLPVPVTAKYIAVAIIGAVLIYATWYRLMVSGFCPAMWQGSAPPVIILISFTTLLGILRKFWR